MSTAAVVVPELRRCVLFVAGADARVHDCALAAEPDVLVQDLEDFTPPQMKAVARQKVAALAGAAAARGVAFAVRINDLDAGGAEDLEAVIAAGVRIVLLPKASAASVAELDRRLVAGGQRSAVPASAVEIVPNIETAAALCELPAIAHASVRVRSALLATEDLAADLLAERGPDAEELAYARSRFLVEARALGIEPIDAPYTYSDAAGCEREARRARRLGYRSKSAVVVEHVAAVQRAMTPSADEVAAAQRIVAAFDAARASGVDRPLVDGLWVEPPAYRNALRLIERATALAQRKAGA